MSSDCPCSCCLGALLGLRSTSRAAAFSLFHATTPGRGGRVRLGTHCGPCSPPRTRSALSQLPPQPPPPGSPDAPKKGPEILDGPTLCAQCGQLRVTGLPCKARPCLCHAQPPTRLRAKPDGWCSWAKPFQPHRGCCLGEAMQVAVLVPLGACNSANQALPPHRLKDAVPEEELRPQSQSLEAPSPANLGMCSCGRLCI